MLTRNSNSLPIAAPPIAAPPNRLDALRGAGLPPGGAGLPPGGLASLSSAPGFPPGSAEAELPPVLSGTGGFLEEEEGSEGSEIIALAAVEAAGSPEAAINVLQGAIDVITAQVSTEEVSDGRIGELGGELGGLVV